MNTREKGNATPKTNATVTNGVISTDELIENVKSIIDANGNALSTATATATATASTIIDANGNAIQSTNASTDNIVIKYDFTDFLAHVNDRYDNDNTLVYGYKNNVQLALAKCGVCVNANSGKYVPGDAYVRFNNNCQFQLHYCAKKDTFVGFNIRLCFDGHKVLFEKWFGKTFTFVKSDNARITKSDYIPFDVETFNEVVNLMITLPKYNRGELVPDKH